MSEARRRAILEAAAGDAELAGNVSPVVAAGFGVLPLRRLGDVLTVACFPHANRHALRLLREVLGLEIVATPFEDRLLHEAIREAYFKGEASVNFPTFLDPEFLDDPASAQALSQEKVEDPGPARRELPPDRVALASLTYRSVLRNLDAPGVGQALPDPRRTRLELGALETGWRLGPAGARVHLGGERLAEDVALVLTEYRLSEYRHLLGGGRVSEHGVRTTAASTLPLVVHPTEVQITGVLADGALVLHVYDHREVVSPGVPRAFGLAYHFLSYGSRMQRRIDVEVHEIVTVPRATLRSEAGAAPWGARELGRWFGLPEHGAPREE